MTKAKQPLAEVFGHLTTDQTTRARRYRNRRLCPFNNRVPSCTKDKAENPLGVCSVHHGDRVAITCPIRFREDWTITDDAAEFFFDEGTNWTSLTEVRLNDASSRSAGNIDVVLVAYDHKDKVIDCRYPRAKPVALRRVRALLDALRANTHSPTGIARGTLPFGTIGSLEVQAVYISGNVREPFEYYMKDAQNRATMDWSKDPSYPRPDYLSSSRKRLAPQLLFKGGILHEWKKKIAVALDSSFFATLPPLKKVRKSDADIAWLVYDLELNHDPGREVDKYSLRKVEEVFTEFEPALLSITTPSPGKIEDFMNLLQERLDERLETPPVNRTIDRILRDGQE